MYFIIFSHFFRCYSCWIEPQMTWWSLFEHNVLFNSSVFIQYLCDLDLRVQESEVIQVILSQICALRKLLPLLLLLLQHCSTGSIEIEWSCLPCIFCCGVYFLYMTLPPAYLGQASSQGHSLKLDSEMCLMQLPWVAALWIPLFFWFLCTDDGLKLGLACVDKCTGCFLRGEGGKRVS